MRICNQCTKENPDDAIFCKYCGERIEGKISRTCQKCGKENPDDAIFCLDCGINLNEGFSISTPIPDAEQTFEQEEPNQAKKKISIFRVWIAAVLRPKTETYEKFAAAENANIKTTALWLLFGALISSIILIILANVLGDLSLGTLSKSLGESGLDMLLDMILISSVGMVLYVLGSIFGAAIINLLANLFGGQGSLDSFSFTTAAYIAPLTIVYAIFGRIPLMGVAGALYSVYLTILAVHAVKKLSWGKSVLIVIFPLGSVLIIFSCFITILLPALIVGLFS